MICPLCGRESDTKDLVCPHCGTNMAEVNDRNLKFPNSPIILYGFPAFMGFTFFCVFLYCYDEVFSLIHSATIFKIYYFSFLIFFLLSLVLAGARIRIRTYSGTRSLGMAMLYEVFRSLEAVNVLYGFLSFGLGLYSLIVSNKDAFFYFTVGFLLMTFAFLLVILKKKVRNS